MLNRYVLCAGVLLSVACVKEKSIETIPEVCAYAPYTKGNTFTYEYASETDTIQYTLTVTGDTVLQGRRFSVLNNGYTNQYIGCDEGRYYLFEAGISLPDYQTKDGIRLFLYDDKTTGAQWTDNVEITYNGMKETGVLQYSILEQSKNITLNGHEYKNVIVVQQDAGLLIDGVVYPLGPIATYYYAKDIGYIYVIGNNYSISLISLSIH